MTEWRLFDEGTVPVFTTPEWYGERERAPHVDQDGHRPRLVAAAAFVERLVRDHSVATLSDLGAGDGGLLSLVRHLHLRSWGFDLAPANVEGAAERGVDVHLRSIFDLGPADFGDVSVATEVLEHLIDPHSFVRGIPSRFLIASSPSGEDADHHYEFHTWAWDRDGYEALLRQGGYEIIPTAEGVAGFHVLLGERR